MKNLLLCLVVGLTCIQMRDNVHKDLLYFQNTVTMQHNNLKSHEMSYTEGQRQRNALQAEVAASKKMYFDNLIEYQTECK